MTLSKDKSLAHIKNSGAQNLNSTNKTDAFDSSPMLKKDSHREFVIIHSDSDSEDKDNYNFILPKIHNDS
jgi:hypothetical protein